MSAELLKKCREIGKLPEGVTDANLQRVVLTAQLEAINEVLGGVVADALGVDGTMKELLIRGLKDSMRESYEKELASIKD